MRDLKTNMCMVKIATPADIIQLKLNIKHMQNLGGIKKLAKNAYEIKIKKNLMTYYHKCCFSPVVST